MQTDAVVEAIQSLERIQNFDTKSLVQSDTLGQFAFHGAVEPAEKIRSLFLQLSPEAVRVFPEAQLSTVKSLSDSAFSHFNEFLTFDLDGGENKSRSELLIKRLVDQYQNYFSGLMPLISYAIARTVDFGRIEMEGRAALQSIADRTKTLLEDIETKNKSAEDLLEAIRKVSAEQGVAQQAIYFKSEADKHQVEAKEWKVRTQWIAGTIAVLGVVSLFGHKWHWLAPSNTFELVQFTFGKILVFVVLGFLLVLSARNFMANRHNEVVNRHRQNALLTYKALSDAGANPQSRDIILSHAAQAIYGLHETGYAKGADSGGPSASIIEMFPKTSMPVTVN